MCYPSRTTTFSDERLDVRIGHLNPAWVRFASAHGGETDIALRGGVGAGISDAMSSAVATQ